MRVRCERQFVDAAINFFLLVIIDAIFDLGLGGLDAPATPGPQARLIKNLWVGGLCASTFCILNTGIYFMRLRHEQSLIEDGSSYRQLEGTSETTREGVVDEEQGGSLSEVKLKTESLRARVIKRGVYSAGTPLGIMCVVGSLWDFWLASPGGPLPNWLNSTLHLPSRVQPAAGLGAKVIGLTLLWMFKGEVSNRKQFFPSIGQWDKKPGEWSYDNMKVEYAMAWTVQATFCALLLVASECVFPPGEDGFKDALRASIGVTIVFSTALIASGVPASFSRCCVTTPELTEGNEDEQETHSGFDKKSCCVIC